MLKFLKKDKKQGAKSATQKPEKTTSYEQMTDDIAVSVTPVYLEEQSSPLDHHYVWAYQVKIENRGDTTVQLKNRHWTIVSATGQTQEVHGSGVVGEQPVLKPGMIFEYTSGTPLNTPSGIMMGRYEMEVSGKGETFDVEIPPFSLDSPHQPQRPN